MLVLCVCTLYSSSLLLYLVIVWSATLVSDRLTLTGDPGPTDVALSSLWPGCLVAKLNRCQTYQRRQRGILCLFCYSIRCLCAVPRRHQRVIQWPPSLYLYAKLCAILLPDACSQKKEVSSFVHITDILRPPYCVPPLLLNAYSPTV